MEKNIQLSLVIPAHNSESTLGKVLPALIEQTNRYSSEIIVVNDGSQDETAPTVLKCAKRSRTTEVLLVNQDSQGQPAALNHGIRRARGKILLFMDSDIIPGRQFVQKHMELHERFKAERAGCQGPVLIAAPGGPLNWRSSTGVARAAECISDWTRIRFSNISLKRNFLMNQPSLFAVHLRLLHDIEMASRLWEKGFQVYYSPEARGYHVHPRSLDDFLKRAEEEARAMNAWIQAEPHAARMLSQEHFRTRFYYISPRPPFHCRLKSFVRRLLMNRRTEGLLIRLCKRISGVNFPVAYRISSQMFINRFTQAYKRFQQGFPERQTHP